MNRSNVIDSIKGIGILAVIFVHFSGKFSLGAIERFAPYGARGVQLLFVINGYLIFKSIDKVMCRREKLSLWYKRKALRIVPQYWIATLLWVLIFGVEYQYWLGPLEKVSILNICCNLLCIHGFYPYYINSINLNWFIANIVIWYLIAPMMWKVLGNSKRTILFSVIYILAYQGLIGRGLNNYFSQENEVLVSYIQMMWFPATFSVILLGVICCCLERSSAVKKLLTSKISSIGTLLVLMTIGVLINGIEFKCVLDNIICWGVLGAALLLFQTYNKWTIIVNPFFTILGKYSYGIYLTHWIIINVLDKTFANRGIGLSICESFLVLFLVCFSSLLFSILMERYIQIPLERYFQTKEKLKS